MRMDRLRPSLRSGRSHKPVVDCQLPSSLPKRRRLIASGVEISPIRLPLRSGVFTADTTIFDGLFGVFNDSLPDGWGRLLLDRTV